MARCRVDDRGSRSETGLSYSTIQHRLADGSLPNSGKKGRPRVRRRELLHQQRRDRPTEQGIDPGEDLLTMRFGG